MKPWKFITLSLAIAAASPALHASPVRSSGCPTSVTSAIAKAFPGSTVKRCSAEREDGRDQFEANVVEANDARLEVDVSPTGNILQTEERIALREVPAAVMKAFAAKYPQAKASSAERQTPASGEKTYELAFVVGHRRQEVTFTESGKFVEAE